MGTIATEAQNIKFRAGQFIKGMVDNARSKFEAVVGRVDAFFEGLVTGDVVGIDANQVPQMKQAIKTYVDELKSHLDTMQTNAQTDEAFKGEYAAAISDFVAAVNQCCYAVISQLLSFSDTLDEVQAKYAEKDSTMAKDISGQAEELRSSYQEYSGPNN